MNALYKFFSVCVIFLVSQLASSDQVEMTKSDQVEMTKSDQKETTRSDQLCPAPLPEQYKNIQAGDKVIAYFGNWDVYGVNKYQISRVEEVADKLTHLVYGFMKPDDVTGRCKPHDLWADIGAVEDVQSKVGGNFAKLMDLKKKFPHLKILLSVGGGKYNKNFLNIAQDHKKLMNFAESCVDMLDFYDYEFRHFENKESMQTHFVYDGLFDGLDIDWEWSPSSLTPELSQAFTQFTARVRELLQLREQQKGFGSLLTVALQVTPKIYKTLEVAKVAQNIDWFHVMAYDFYGPYSGTIGFNAPVCGSTSVYTVDGAVQAIMKQGVSPDKMVLGLPLYGYVYEDSNGYNSTIKSKKGVKTLSYHMIKSKYLSDPSFKKGWSSYEKVPSLYSAKDKVFISYDGKDSLIDKVRLAQYKRMQGVVLWRLSGDDAQHSMVHAIAQAMGA